MVAAHLAGLAHSVVLQIVGLYVQITPISAQMEVFWLKGVSYNIGRLLI